MTDWDAADATAPEDAIDYDTAENQTDVAIDTFETDNGVTIGASGGDNDADNDADTENDEHDDLDAAAKAHLQQALARIEAQIGRPPAEQVPAFADAHQALQATLNRIDAG
jgi:hypothetical protein